MIECKQTLTYLEHAPDVAYQNALNDFDSTRRGAKGLIVTRSTVPQRQVRHTSAG